MMTKLLSAIFHSGGVVDRNTVALWSLASNAHLPEAFVPLPDGGSTPVKVEERGERRTK